MQVLVEYENYYFIPVDVYTPDGLAISRIFPGVNSQNVIKVSKYDNKVGTVSIEDTIIKTTVPLVTSALVHPFVDGVRFTREILKKLQTGSAEVTWRGSNMTIYADHELINPESIPAAEVLPYAENCKIEIIPRPPIDEWISQNPECHLCVVHIASNTKGCLSHLEFGDGRIGEDKELFGEQRAILEDLIEFSKDRVHTNVFVCAPTGTGKTITGCYPIKWFVTDESEEVTAIPLIRIICGGAVVDSWMSSVIDIVGTLEGEGIAIIESDDFKVIRFCHGVIVSQEQYSEKKSASVVLPFMPKIIIKISKITTLSKRVKTDLSDKHLEYKFGQQTWSTYAAYTVIDEFTKSVTDEGIKVLYNQFTSMINVGMSADLHRNNRAEVITSDLFDKLYMYSANEGVVALTGYRDIMHCCYLDYVPDRAKYSIAEREAMKRIKSGKFGTLLMDGGQAHSRPNVNLRIGITSRDFTMSHAVDTQAITDNPSNADKHNVSVHLVRGLWSSPPDYDHGYVGLLNQLSKDVRRNTLICDILDWILKELPNKSTYIFCDRIEQVVTIRDIIRSRHEDLKVGTYTGKNTSEEKSSVLDGCDVILCTYQCASVGLNCPRMTNMIFGTPRLSNCNQIVGRILRFDKKYADIKRHVFDIYDGDSRMDTDSDVPMVVNNIFFKQLKLRCDYYFNQSTWNVCSIDRMLFDENGSCSIELPKVR